MEQWVSILGFSGLAYELMFGIAKEIVKAIFFLAGCVVGLGISMKW